MGQLPESTAAENYFFILQRKILSATDVFHFSCWYIKCVLFSPQSDGYCCNGCNGFSQPWMTQPLRNPQLRHAAAGSRRNGFRYSGYPIHRARLFRNRTGILRIQPLSVQKLATDQCSSESESSQRARERVPASSSSSDSRQSPALSHLSTHILSPSPSLFFSSISPLSNQFPSSSSVPPSSVFKYSRHFPLATNFSSSPLFVGPCNPSGLHWTPCYTFP